MQIFANDMDYPEGLAFCKEDGLLQMKLIICFKEGYRVQCVYMTTGHSMLAISVGSIMLHIRVAELGSLSSRAKMAMKIFVKRVFTIFASNALFLRVIANLQN